jgi:hypothetical protein
MTLDSTIYVLFALALLLGVSVIPLRLWAQWHTRREQKRINALIEPCALWTCPACQIPFGRDVDWVFCTRDQKPPEAAIDFDLNKKPFARWLIGTCPHCQHLNGFDRTGAPQFGKGVLFDPQAEKEKEERWQRLAVRLECPDCGAAYEKWDGDSWGHGGIIGTEGPVLTCRHCGAQTCVADVEEVG